MVFLARVGASCLLSLSILGVSLPISAAGAEPAAGQLSEETSKEEALVETLEELRAPRASGRITVTYDAAATSDDRDRIRDRARSTERLLADVDLLTVDEAAMVNLLVDLKTDPAVVGAEPDAVVATTTDLSAARVVELEATSIPNDPGVEVSDGWDMQGPYIFGDVPASMFGANATEAWYQGYLGTSDGIVAVVDSGADISHPDLAANIWKNTREVANNGRDDDANGFIDDVNGWNFYDNNNRVYMSAAEDEHGTHVAGTIAAVANNGIGISGLAPRTKVLPVKFLGPGGEGTTSDAILALKYIVTLKKAGAPITAVNASWGGPVYSSALAAAIDAVGDENILVVAAAGNEGVSTPFYPAAQTCETKWGVDCIISVASHNQYGMLSDFSNYGDYVDVSAPGEEILSTWPANKYAIIDGTSMAAPHVAASISTCRGVESVLTLQEKRDSVLNTGTPMSSLSGHVQTGSALNVVALAASCGDTRMPKMDYLPPVEALEAIRSEVSLVPHGRVKTGTWAVVSAPAGVSVNTSTGVLSYTPERFGSYTATISIRNAQGVTTSGTLPLKAYVYADVTADSYYEPAVHWLRVNQITTGMTPTTYGPQVGVSRAQMAAFLWRAAGSPSYSSSCGFADQTSIPEYARSAACWLKANEITTNNPFKPSGAVDRSQMAAFLWRSSGSPFAPSTCGFVDQSTIPTWARQAACWLKDQGITTNASYNPNGLVTRAQMAAFLWRTAGSP